MEIKKGGPPPTNRRRSEDFDYPAFVDAIVAAAGEWVSTVVEAKSPHGAIYAEYGKRFVEVAVRDGKVYARVRTADSL